MVKTPVDHSRLGGFKATKTKFKPLPSAWLRAKASAKKKREAKAAKKAEKKVAADKLKADNKEKDKIKKNEQEKGSAHVDLHPDRPPRVKGEASTPKGAPPDMVAAGRKAQPGGFVVPFGIGVKIGVKFNSPIFGLKFGGFAGRGGFGSPGFGRVSFGRSIGMGGK